MKKKFGDRYDGRRVRHCDPFNVIIPFIMRERNDAQVLFDAEIDVSEVEKLIRDSKFLRLFCSYISKNAFSIS